MSLIRSDSTVAEPALGLRCRNAFEEDSRLTQSSQPIASSPAILQQTSTPPSFSLVVRRVPPQPQHTTPAAGKKGAPEVTQPFPRYLTGHQGTGVCLSVASQKVKRCIRMIAVIILISSAALRLDEEACKVVRWGRC